MTTASGTTRVAVLARGRAARGRGTLADDGPAGRPASTAPRRRQDHRLARQPDRRRPHPIATAASTTSASADSDEPDVIERRGRVAQFDHSALAGRHDERLLPAVEPHGGQRPAVQGRGPAGIEVLVDLHVARGARPDAHGAVVRLPPEHPHRALVGGTAGPPGARGRRTRLSAQVQVRQHERAGRRRQQPVPSGTERDLVVGGAQPHLDRQQLDQVSHGAADRGSVAFPVDADRRPLAAGELERVPAVGGRNVQAGQAGNRELGQPDRQLLGLPVDAGRNGLRTGEGHRQLAGAQRWCQPHDAARTDSGQPDALRAGYLHARRKRGGSGCRRAQHQLADRPSPPPAQL